ncbi:MAG TPA: PH domain-containing protein [Pyrinomonadaceae bacterium]|jgi:putative membrane protein|nr:PH domain-containing protein [Pyrinomonadaceae bacterium]
MFCIKCGAVMNDEAEFCAKCGYAAGDAEVTRVAAPVSRMQLFEPEHPEEVHIFSIRPTALFINIGYVLAILAGIVLVVLLAMLPISVPWWISVLVGLSPLLVPAYHHLMRNMILYTLTDSKIEIDKGFISRTTRNIPLGKVQDVTVSAGMLQRMLGFGDLVIENAGENTGRIVLKNISSPRHYADLLLKQLRRVHRLDM